MPGSSTMTWTRRLRRTPIKSEWPNPEACTGTFYRKMGRDFSCWEAIDEARRTFIRIADEIKAHLEKHSDPISHSVTWTMYMIGKTRETAEPMVMFCCRDLDCRKQVRKIVEESGIVDKYPGVRVGDASMPPDFDQLVPLAGEGSRKSRTDINVPEFFGGRPSAGYRYSPLDRSKLEIRLLLIQPAGHSSWMPSCKLVTVSLGKDSPAYRVIKCDLGAPEQIHRIRLNDQFWNVPTNIYEMLKRLRSSGTETFVWIEAVCVNKWDIEETDEQARLTDTILRMSSGTETLVKYSPFHQEQALLREPSDSFFGVCMILNDYKTPGTFMRKVTAGGVFRSNDEYYFLTVDHVFERQDDSTSPAFSKFSNSSDDDFEFDIGNEGSLEDEELGFINETSRGSLTPEIAKSSSSDDTIMSNAAFPSFPDSFEGPNQTGQSAVNRDEDESLSTSTPLVEPVSSTLELAGILLHRSEKLDYALVKIPKVDTPPSNQIPLDDGTILWPRRMVESLPIHGTKVLTITGSAGLLRGSISGMPTYSNLPGYKTFQEHWTVKFDGRLADGDCGSWVVGAETGDLFGHIVAGSPKSGSAYIVPTYQVLQRLKTSEFSRLAKSLRLPDSEIAPLVAPQFPTWDAFKNFNMDEEPDKYPRPYFHPAQADPFLPEFETPAGTKAVTEYPVKGQKAQADDMSISSVITPNTALPDANMEHDLHWINHL